MDRTRARTRVTGGENGTAAPSFFAAAHATLLAEHIFWTQFFRRGSATAC